MLEEGVELRGEGTFHRRTGLPAISLLLKKILISSLTSYICNLF